MKIGWVERGIICGRVLKRQPQVHRGARAAVGECPRVVGSRQDLEDAEVSAPVHHTDYREWTLVEPDRLADDRRIAPERPGPEALADHDHRRTARPRLVWREATAREGLHAQHRQQFVRHFERLEANRLAALRRVVHLAARECGELLDALAALLKVEKVGQRRGLACRARIAVRLPDHGQRADVPHRRRAQQDRVDDAENRGVGANPECHRQQRDHGKAGVADEHADGVAKVLSHGWHSWLAGTC